MRIIKNTIWLLLLTTTILIVWLNIKLYTDNLNREERKKDIILQLNYLNRELKTNHLGERMQSIFPEGFVFTNVLYGLSWCEVGLVDTSLYTRKNSLNEALFAYEQISSTKAKSLFDPTLNPENGIFYLGWTNYLLSKLLQLDSSFDGSRYYKIVYNKNCELIVDALTHNNSPFLQSYQNQAWPADMCVAMASLSNYEKFNDTRYHSVVTNWVTAVKSKVDPRTKLIPHKVNPENGKTIEGARGCSISLILRLISEVDSDFSKEQYALYKKNFVSTTFGLPSIDEYPVGLCGSGDIDSGPVIFGVGFAGTIVSIGTFSVMGDYELAEKQYKTINAFGFSTKDSDMKKYVLGQMPIADAFIAWSRTAELNDKSNFIMTSNFWAYKFHFISFIVILILWTLFYHKIILKKLQLTAVLRYAGSLLHSKI